MKMLWINIIVTLVFSLFFLLNEASVNRKEWKKAKKDFKEHLKDVQDGKADRDPYWEIVYTYASPKKKFFITRIILGTIIITGIIIITFMV